MASCPETRPLPYLWPPGGQAMTHWDTLRHTSPRENVVFSTRGVGSSPTSGSRKPASRAGFGVPTGVEGQRGARETLQPKVGQLPTTEVAEELLRERHAEEGTSFPSVDLEGQIPATPAIQFSEAKGNTNEGQDGVCWDEIEAPARAPKGWPSSTRGRTHSRQP